MAILQGGGVLFLFAYFYYESLLSILFLLPIGMGYLWLWEQDCLAKKRRNFQRQFKEALGSLSASLQVGYSIENGMKEVKRDLDVIYSEKEPIQREFTYMLRQIRLRVPMEQIVEEWAQRMELEEVTSFAAIFSTAKRSGGNMIGIMKDAIKQLEGKLEVAEEIETILTAKKYEFKVLSVIPFFVIAYMKFSFPEFMQVLYKNSIGIGVMTGCLLVYLAAYGLGRKIVKIEV